MTFATSISRQSVGYSTEHINLYPLHHIRAMSATCDNLQELSNTVDMLLSTHLLQPFDIYHHLRWPEGIYRRSNEPLH